MMLVAGMAPVEVSEPKILGAVMLGMAPRTDTSPNGPAPGMEGGEKDTGQGTVFAAGWMVVSDPPSPCKEIFSMTSLLTRPGMLGLKVSTAVIRATTAPRATLLGWVLFPVPLLLAVLTPWTVKSTSLLSKLPSV